MTFKEFKSKLARCNASIRIIPGPGISWGLFYKAPRHPEANDSGLVHVCGVTAPTWFAGKMPEASGYRMVPDRLRGRLPAAVVNRDGSTYVRGWRVIIRLLVDKHLIGNSAARSQFGWQWRVG